MSRLPSALRAALLATVSSAADWSPDLALRVRRVQAVQPSPDGTRVAYVVGTAVTEGEKSEWLSHVHVAKADGSSAFALLTLWLVPARASISDEIGTEVQAEIGGNLFRQTVGRFFLGVSHFEWPWYYLENLPVDLLPWTLFLPYALLFAWRHRRAGQSERFLLAWTVPALIFFSISLGKRALYLLPLYPAFAILLSGRMGPLPLLIAGAIVGFAAQAVRAG